MDDRKDATEPAFWFNLRTKEVEFGLKTKAVDRVGPFATREEAERALETLAERSRDWRDSEQDED